MTDPLIPLGEIDQGPARRDFRRANGSPMVRKIDDPTKWDRYSRPSGWGSDLDEQSALVNWRIDRAMEGIASDPALRATVASHQGIKEGAKERRERAIQAGRGEQAADMGTALHLMAERVERADGFIPPPPYDADIAALLQCMSEHGLESELIECKLCSDEWRAAGTADRIYRVTRELQPPSGPPLTPGQLVLGDLKTGAWKDYSVPSYTIQLAIYVDSVLYDVETNERTPMPDGLRTDWGLIVHLPAGEATCELYWVDLEVGRAGATLVRMVRSWRKRSDFAYSVAAPDSTDDAVMSATVEPESFIPDPDVEPNDQWLEAMTPWAQERINLIGRAGNEPRDMLLRRWPSGVPPLRESAPNEVQLAKILGVLDAVEAAFSLPFIPGDPRAVPGVYRDELNRTNHPPANTAPPSNGATP